MVIATGYVGTLPGEWFYNEEYKKYFRSEKDVDKYAELLKRAEEQKNNPELEPLPDTRPTIPDALIYQWAEKYDPKNMTQEEYQAFIDDLISAGVLQESDKFYIRYDPNLIVLDLGEKGFRMREVTPADLEYCPDGYYFTLAQAGGNALRWAEGWKNYYGEINSNTSDTMRKILSRFDKISWILGRMEDVK